MGFIQKYVTDPIREAIAEVRQAIIDEIKAQIPVIIKAVVVAITETLGKTAISAADKITDAIPGEADDQIIDPLVTRIVEVAKRLGLDL